MMQRERLGSARTPCGGGIARARCERSAIRLTVAAFPMTRSSALLVIPTDTGWGMGCRLEIASPVWSARWRLTG